jgi:hypothetical protein
MKFVLLIVSLAVLAALSPSRSDDRYSARKVRGWTVQVERGVGENAKGKEALDLLERKLYDVERAVPAKALAKLKDVVIWVSRDDAAAPCSCYHPSPEWLKEHGFDERKARGVEITNVEHFVQWTHEQPAMVLHELAHAYHHQVLGWDDAGVRSALERARASGAYDDVLYFDGTRQRAYALNNEMEFFAELSEAWLGTNDFFPFVRAEVLASDPQSAQMLRAAWGG